MNWAKLYDKVAAGGTSGLATTAIIAILATFHITLPSAVVAAIVTLVMFGVSYLTRETKAARVIQTVEQAVERG